MLNFISSVALLLAQNEAEKSITLIGLAFFAAFMLFLALDSVIKQKFIPKNKTIRGFLIFLFIIAAIACIWYMIFIK